MAYFNQEKKAKIAPMIRELCKKYKVKGSLSVRDHRTVCFTITEGPIDFIQNYAQTTKNLNAQKYDHLPVNTYWYQNHFSGVAKEFISKALDILNIDNYDNSDIQVDYFDCGHYVDVKIGKWNKPYQLLA
jgi:hypothetical protein